MRSTRSILARGTTIALLGAGALLPLAGPAAADGSVAGEGPNLIINGGFERGIDPGSMFPFPAGDSSVYLQAWKPLNYGDKFRPGVILIGTRLAAQEGTKCLELDNGGLHPRRDGGVAQTFATVAGRTYRLSFFQSANIFDAGPRIMQFTVAGQTRQYTYVPGADEWQNKAKMRWIDRSFVFTAQGAATTLEFDSVLTTATNAGSAIDNVQVHALATQSSSPATTPQPQPSPAPAPATQPAGETTLHLLPPSAPAGSQERLQGTARPNASVSVIVDYPDGTQFLVPVRADAAGRYGYEWTLPSNIKGLVHVLVDAAGSIAQGTFQVV